MIETYVAFIIAVVSVSISLALIIVVYYLYQVVKLLEQNQQDIYTDLEGYYSYQRVQNRVLTAEERAKNKVGTWKK